MLSVKLEAPEVYDEKKILHQLHSWGSMIQDIEYLFGENEVGVKVNYTTPSITQVIIEGRVFCHIVDGEHDLFYYGNRTFKSLPGAVSAAVVDWEADQE